MKRSILLIALFSFLLFGMNGFVLSNDGHTEDEHKTEVHDSHGDAEHTDAVKAEDHSEAHAEVHESHGEEHREEGHHSDFSGLFFVIMTLIVGAATRHFLRNFPLPFTVLLLIFGIGLGLLNRFHLLDDHGAVLETVSKSIKWAGHMDPHAILFIFLPILIFEAAFAMDVHTFKKTSVNAIILAVPGIIVALVMSAGMAMLLKKFNIGLGGWEWGIALMFGSVISATDPVAVVALLKELGASKKLGTLIEGESLLNDGTAIVIFMVFFTTITGLTAENNALVEFGRVAFGGVLIGLIIAGVVVAWVKRVFNDALVEISVIIAAAYLAFFVAEHFMHVSGVLALVSLGLTMAGVGKTRISPEVGHFLHEFWELAAFMANVLIFFIVGVVIAQRTQFTANDFLILGIIYIGIHIVRGVMILMFYPLMKRIGYGMNAKDATVLWYGALRGAIGLALALVVLNVPEKFLSEEIRNQFFFIIAGIVTLTLLINATTIKFIVNGLGLTKVAPAKALMMLEANKYLRESSENAMEKIKADRFMGKANWDAVKEYLPDPIKEINPEDIGEFDNIAEIRRRILEKEKSSYWSQFKEGLIGSAAVMKLNDGINDILDKGGKASLSDRADLEREWRTPKLLNRMQTLPLIGMFARKMFFDQLSSSYDSAKGFVVAQEEALKLVQSMIIGRDSESEVAEHEMETIKLMEQEINENRIHGLTFIRNLRNTFPEIYKAIATKQAVRSVLNYEMKIIDRLQKKGRIDSGETEKIIHSIEHRMKKLQDSPPSFAMSDQYAALNNVSWLQNLDEAIIAKVKKAFQNKLFSIGEKIVKEDAPGNGMYLITRGKVKIMVGDKVIDVIGTGNVIGEMAVLKDMPRTASIVAESPVTALFISNKNMRSLMSASPELEKSLWNYACVNYSESLLRKQEPFTKWGEKEKSEWLKFGKESDMKEGEEVKLTKQAGILVEGQVERLGEKRELMNGPCVLENGDIIKSASAKVYTCSKKV